jgi:GT2 family glycosyltransferase
MADPQQLQVVIPVFNGWSQTRQCLDSLRQSTFQDFSVLVVDHGSTDDTRKNLESDYPEVTRIVGTPDLWWTGATNLGIRAAIDRGAKAIMLLNNDCYLDAGAIGALHNSMSHIGNGVVAPVQQRYSDGAVQTTPLRTCFLLGFPMLHTSRKSLYHPGTSEPIPVRMIQGGRGAIVPTSVFERVGLLNERELPHYGSDLDFYLRCRNQGIPLFVVPNAVVHVDDTRTTMARRLRGMSLREFLETFRSRRSHRNLRDLSALFRLHYPIPGLWRLGVSLNLLRYTLLYLLARGTGVLIPRK